MENNNHLFRTAVFGGFNKDDVIDYIENMRNEFHSYRQQVEETISGLKKKIRDLEAIGLSLPIESEQNGFELPGEEIKASNQQIMTSVSEINEATEQLRKTADLLCSSLGDFISKLNDNSLSVNVAVAAEKGDAVLADADLHKVFVEKIFSSSDSKSEEAVPAEEITEETEENIEEVPDEAKGFFDDIIAQAKIEVKESVSSSGNGSILDGFLSSAFISK